jgi:hypothetical protein
MRAVAATSRLFSEMCRSRRAACAAPRPSKRSKGTPARIPRSSAASWAGNFELQPCGIAREGIEGALDDGRALAALWEDHQERETLGIQGSPTYVFDDGRAILYGNVSEGVINATVDELLGGTIAGRSDCG